MNVVCYVMSHNPFQFQEVPKKVNQQLTIGP